MKLGHFLIVISALLAGACSDGGSKPKPATKLSYSDPTGDGWRLVKANTSTDQHLVLSLIGPPNLRGRGVGLVVQGNADFEWGRIDGKLVNDMGVFQYHIDPADPYELEPTLFVSTVKDSALQISAYQKNRALSAKALNQPLLQIALDFKANPSLYAGDVVTASIVKAFLLPEYLTTGRLEPVSIQLGKIVAY